MSDVERTEWQRLTIPGNHGDVYIEVVMQGGREDVGILDSLPFGQISGMISGVAQGIGDAIKAVKPNKSSVELGLEFGMQEGKLVALIARGSGKANLKIKLEW
jgi:hypothetical protein